MIRRTLAEFNASPTESEWGPGIYRLRRLIGVGKAGRRGLGRELHVVRYSTIVAELREPRPGAMRLGATFSAHAACGTRSNGQHTARVLPGLDTDRVTCERCLKRFGWLEGVK